MLFRSKAPFSFLFVLKLLLNLCPFLNHNLLSPVNQFYNPPFPRIINIFRPVFIFPDFFFFQRVYLSVIYLYICGEGNGTPLQDSCRKNPMDGGAWWAAVHGVAKSQTRLSDFTFTFMHWRRKWQPTPVFLPGESQGPGSLVGYRLWVRTKLDTTEVT